MDEPRSLPIDGLTVTRIAIDDSLTLFCRAGDGRAAEIRIDGRFSLRAADGATSEGCVEDNPSSAGPALNLILGLIRAARIDEGGGAVIDFADGTSLAADAEEHFVSWEVSTSAGFHAVCLADRDVVVKDVV